MIKLSTNFTKSSQRGSRKGAKRQWREEVGGIITIIYFLRLEIIIRRISDLLSFYQREKKGFNNMYVRSGNFLRNRPPHLPANRKAPNILQTSVYPFQLQ